MCLWRYDPLIPEGEAGVCLYGCRTCDIALVSSLLVAPRAGVLLVRSRAMASGSRSYPVVFLLIGLEAVRGLGLLLRVSHISYTTYY